MAQQALVQVFEALLFRALEPREVLAQEFSLARRGNRDALQLLHELAEVEGAAEALGALDARGSGFEVQEEGLLRGGHDGQRDVDGAHEVFDQQEVPNAQQEGLREVPREQREQPLDQPHFRGQPAGQHLAVAPLAGGLEQLVEQEAEQPQHRKALFEEPHEEARGGLQQLHQEVEGRDLLEAADLEHEARDEVHA